MPTKIRNPNRQVNDIINACLNLLRQDISFIELSELEEKLGGYSETFKQPDMSRIILSVTSTAKEVCQGGYKYKEGLTAYVEEQTSERKELGISTLNRSFSPTRRNINWTNFLSAADTYDKIITSQPGIQSLEQDVSAARAKVEKGYQPAFPEHDDWGLNSEIGKLEAIKAELKDKPYDKLNKTLRYYLHDFAESVKGRFSVKLNYDEDTSHMLKYGHVPPKLGENPTDALFRLYKVASRKSHPGSEWGVRENIETGELSCPCKGYRFSKPPDKHCYHTNQIKEQIAQQQVNTSS